MSENKFFKNEPSGGNAVPELISKHRLPEHFLAKNIDNGFSNEIFSRIDKEPNSLFSYWDQIMSENGIPKSPEQRKEYYLYQMDNVNFEDVYKGRIPSDKDYVEKNLNVEFSHEKEKSSKFKEKLLERIYAHCLVKIFKSKDILCGGENEEISLDSFRQTHFYDLSKRQVQQVLSISDERFPKEKFNIGLGVQWGHEKTDYEAIKYRLSYIVSGLVDYNSMTEICYTDIDKGKKMPAFMPMAVVGGDIKHMAYLIDRVMKGDYSAVVSSSIIYNTLIQMKTQIDLFYKILLQQKNRYSNSPSHLSKEDQIKFNNKVDIYNNNVSVLKSTKNIIDQIVEANDPFIKRAKPDSIHNKLQDICREIAEENGVKD